MIELYRHNQDAYDKVLNHLETSNRTCVIHPTGTGKSFIALKWLYENKDKKCLFLTSSKVILEQLIRYIGKSGLTMNDFTNLELGLYSSLNDNNKKYDCIVLDEFHRCGALEWGQEVNKILNNNKESKVLGISATPIRYLENQRDMSEEIFNGNIASKMSLAEAIVLGILPVPIYVNCLFTFQEDLDNIQNKINKCKSEEKKITLQQRLDKVKHNIESVIGIDEIIEKYFYIKSGKLVVFCKDREHMRKMQPEVRKWFSKINPNINIGEVCYDISEEANKYTIDRFNNVKNDDINLLFSVDMLNEGLHVERINGEIMLRPTESLNVYLQQLGRALGSAKGIPLIFDIVSNCASFYNVYDFVEEVKEIVEIYKLKTTDEKELERLDSVIKQFQVIDEYKDIVDMLQDINFDATFTWDDWYNLAKDYFNIHGNLKVPRRYQTKEGYQLGNWIIRQKSNRNLLSKERIEMLNEIGMIWDNVKDEDFYSWYNLAKAYFKYYGNLNIDYKFKTKDGITYDEDGIYLGDIISRKRRSKNLLKKEHIKLLDEIGMIWDLREHNQNEYFDLAKKYFEHYGNLNIRNDFKTKDGINYAEDGIKIGGWIHRLRDDFANERLSKEEIDRMNSIKMIWNYQDYVWNAYYILAKKYFEEHGNLDIKARYITSEDIKLGAWIQRQKTDYVNKNLSKERIKKLEDIGIIWNVKEDNLVRSKIDSKSEDEVTEYLCDKLDVLLNEYSNMSFKTKSDIDKLNKEFEDLIYVAKKR